MTNGSTKAEKAKWQSMRATPRKLTATELHQRAVARRDAKRSAERYALDMRKATAEGDSSRRHKKREAAHVLYRHRLKRDRQIGTDPKYLNTIWPRNRAVLSAQWKQEAKAWDKAHPIST